AQDLDDHVRGAENGSAFWKNLRSPGTILGVWIARFGTGARLDDYLQTRFQEAWNHRGHQCHAALTGVVLSRHSDNHDCSPIRRIKAPKGRVGSLRLLFSTFLLWVPVRPSFCIEHLGIRRIGHNDPRRSPSLSSKCPCWNGRPGFPIEPARFSFNEHKPHYQTVLASPPQFTRALSPSLRLHWPPVTGHYSLPSCDHQAIGRDCSLSTIAVNPRGPPPLPRAELGIHGLRSWGRNLSRNESPRNAEFKQPETVRARRPPLPGARWPGRR